MRPAKGLTEGGSSQIRTTNQRSRPPPNPPFSRIIPDYPATAPPLPQGLAVERVTMSGMPDTGGTAGVGIPQPCGPGMTGIP